ncbi:MAG: VIT1/CCC1 transporter family protein [Candidatus Micrarchaeota archaeon]|nr:VIT1/CCC1 transporter family protein [Candidatus Micrarchaeota archaeon]MDE1847923.1 VIT1/CCC1 transporter family protein [Candidatus Micrarchaeota archaeon]MDE1864831.1 VIT1/CCC1 transporter family protein [Candidatus Micrarchaeota archaeon]
MSQRDQERIKTEQEFFKDEYTDHMVYEHLARGERHLDLRGLMLRLAKMEKEHMKTWEAVLISEGAFPSAPLFAWVKVLGFGAIKRLFGIAFMSKLLERNEIEGINAYYSSLNSNIVKGKTKGYVKRIIKEEQMHERELLSLIETHEGSLGYMKSIVFGLSDGLVEVLAAVAGLAAFVSSAPIVVVGGIIVGVAGTLSMAGGAYLSSKSQNIVSKAIEERTHKLRMTEPTKDAYYTGVFYFVGSLVPLIPFLFGMTGYFGIAVAVLLDILALVMASIVIGVVSDTSIKKRSLEMIIITLGAAAVTIIIGSLARLYFGVAI